MNWDALPQNLLGRLLAANVRPEQVEWRTCRASGPGGQHVNKVSTAVEVVHMPSGLKVVASDSRSQYANRCLALSRLVAELERRREEKKKARLAATSKARRQRAHRSPGTKREMVESKRRRGETKQLRRKIND